MYAAAPKVKQLIQNTQLHCIVVQFRGCELERMEETLRMQLPETDATTAGGWIVEQLGRIPHTGETLLLHGYQFQIEKANPRKVLLFSATPHTESASTAAF